MDEAPHVVRRRALPPARPDGLPLEQVVRALVRPGLGHPAVRLDDPVPAADQQQDRADLAGRGRGEQQPGSARSAGRPPRRPGRPPRTGAAARSAATLAHDPVERLEGSRVDVGVDVATTIPFGRALLTYWRHFLRRSDQSASSSAARSTIRVRRGLHVAAPVASRCRRAVRGPRHPDRAGHRARSRGRSGRWPTRRAGDRRARATTEAPLPRPRGTSRSRPSRAGRAGRRRTARARGGVGAGGSGRRTARPVRARPRPAGWTSRWRP